MHHADADDAGNEVDSLDDQREEDALDTEDGIKSGSQNHGADVFSSGRFEDVRAAARAVANIVTNQIRNHGRVTRIIFGNSGFYLADEVCTHVSGLGVDATTELGKESH